MAPFNTHFLIAERLWPELEGPWQLYYGQFCFGCVAPDVDKVSDTLSQKDTHFFDRSGKLEHMVTHRTAAFIKAQAHFLRHSFVELPPSEQAFVLGYLCHLCVDEGTKHMWGRETWLKFRAVNVGGVGAFCALDESIRSYFQNYAAIAEALCAITPFDSIVPISLADLTRMHVGVCEFAYAETTAGGLMILANLMMHTISLAEREARVDQVLAELPRARHQVHHFDFDVFLRASLRRSRSRLADLIAGRVPEPSTPDLA